MHTVAVAVFDNVVASDFSTPYDVFRHVRLPDSQPAYRVLLCGASPEVSTLGLSIRVECSLDELRTADTVVIPGLNDIRSPISDELLAAIRAAAERRARIASVCTGAFILAATGLLDGRRATTHWLAAAELARRHPSIEVDPNVLYVDNGSVLTSAGAAAAMDLCLHMIRRDHGASVAAHAAGMAVTPLERDGGQAQFIVRDWRAGPDRSLDPLLEWLETQLHRPLSLDDIAQRAAMSKRTLNRHFIERLGSAPMQWLLRLRVRRAQHLLETTDTPLERIATDVGFGSSAALRRHFCRIVGSNPQSYRRSLDRRSAGHPKEVGASAPVSREFGSAGLATD
jgi:transcriptional regulator GlxA family with amidase domain